MGNPPCQCFIKTLCMGCWQAGVLLVDVTVGMIESAIS